MYLQGKESNLIYNVRSSWSDDGICKKKTEKKTFELATGDIRLATSTTTGFTMDVIDIDAPWLLVLVRCARDLRILPHDTIVYWSSRGRSRISRATARINQSIECYNHHDASERNARKRTHAEEHLERQPLYPHWISNVPLASLGACACVCVWAMCYSFCCCCRRVLLQLERGVFKIARKHTDRHISFRDFTRESNSLIFGSERTSLNIIIFDQFKSVLTWLLLFCTAKIFNILEINDFSTKT